MARHGWGLFRAIVMTVPMAFSFAARADLVITMGGDVNFNKSTQKPLATGVDFYGKIVPFEQLSAGIRKLIDGDLNFMNVETVVTDRQDLSGQTKAFTFQSHPNGMRHMMNLGFNLFSLSNNHAFDYGFEGLRETLRSFETLRTEYSDIHFSGLGRNYADAVAPVIFEKNGHTIAFAAIGINSSDFRAGPSSLGLLDFYNETDFMAVLKAMRATKADLKILSIHYGTEKQLVLDRGQRARYHRALKEGGVDLIIGHHPHVVRPVEIVDGKIIIYSLGNFLMPGAAAINDRDSGFDYGLFARVFFGADAKTGRLKAQAMEAVPLRLMHLSPRPRAADEAAVRIRGLNELSANQLGAQALQFTVRADGSGAFCDASALELTERAAQVCASILPPIP